MFNTLHDRIESPANKVLRSVEPWSSYVVLPIFALANAGVVLGGDALRGAVVDPVALGAVLGLMIGKPAGIVGFSWLAVRLGVASLPTAVSWRMLAGAGVLGGVGFTMALFIADLAFEDEALLAAAKLGILTASALAGLVGWALIRSQTTTHAVGSEHG